MACEGKRIDVDHDVVRRYLEGKGVAVPDSTPLGSVAPSAKVQRARERARAHAVSEAAEADETPTRTVASVEAMDPSDIEGIEDLTLRELTARFGTTLEFKDWLDARKKVADIREKDLKNFETEGKLISRELVEHHVFGAIENANRQLLADSPKTITRRIYAMARSGAPLEEAERVVRDIISSQLRPVKATASRVLRNA